MSLNEILFFLVILGANIIQGITGFAGTILAMPMSLMLVGYDVAKPVLNVLGLLSGIYVFVGHYKNVNWKEFRKVVCIMTIGILAGIAIKNVMNGQDAVLFKLLGVFVVVLAVQGLFVILHSTKKEKACAVDCLAEEKNQSNEKPRKKNTPGNTALLLGAGIAHGIFVSGGPLVVAYLSKVLKDKEIFRSTISTVWIVLNTIILVDDVYSGLWNLSLCKTQLISIPFLLIGMYIGAKLYKIMSQKVFMVLTYLLLFISGVSLLMK